MGSEVFFEDRHFASIHNFNEMDEGLSFLTNDESFIQVGTWNYEKNKILDAHYTITILKETHIALKR